MVFYRFRCVKDKNLFNFRRSFQNRRNYMKRTRPDQQANNLSANSNGKNATEDCFDFQEMHEALHETTEKKEEKTK